MRKIVVMLVTVAAVSVALLICLSVWHSACERRLGTEVFKLVYQFLLITVVGGLLAGLITLFYNQFIKEQEKRVAARRALAQMRQQLNENYVLAIDEILRLKYLIGARAVKGTSVVQRPYDKLMGELLLAMFRLNSLKRTVAASEARLWGTVNKDIVEENLKRKDMVEKNLESIVSYVNDIANEYDSSPEVFDPETHTCPRSKLPFLDEFLILGSKNFEASRFKTQFYDPDSNVRLELGRLQLETD